MKMDEFESILTQVNTKEKDSVKEGRGMEKILEYILINKNTTLARDTKLLTEEKAQSDT
jgi:hypothetical protein